MNKPLGKILDILSIASVVGIWPRFIEPYYLTETNLDLALPGLDKSLDGLRILQFSDLHLHSGVPDFYLKKITNKIKKNSPDVVVFTGDFLCYSVISDKDRLKSFLNSISAPLGCFAIFGNHDYATTVSVRTNGDYDIVENIEKGLERLFHAPPKERKITERASNVETHEGLIELLKETPFELLDNRSKLLKGKLNICGLGEYMLGKCLPKKAFEEYDNIYPGIILAHNPDCVARLHGYPGDLILCGHTHGSQVNLPWLWKRLLLVENTKFKRGLIKEHEKWVYVNRGVGSTMPFRVFSFPEILNLTLRSPS